MKRIARLAGLLAALAAFLVFVVPNALGEGGLQLVPDTAVLLSNTGGGGGGNGGNTSSASSATNIFSPASYVDYHEIGGEPTTVVDRYPFGPGTMPSCALLGTPTPGTNPTCTQQAACPSTATPCFHDLVYVSNPVGLPTYSEFYKSSDGGQTFRVPAHNPYFLNEPLLNSEGGGDSHHAVGEVTHSVFFTDLSGGCVTMNISRDLGESFSNNPVGCQTSPGAIDDRQWVETDETAPDGQDVFVNFNNDTLPFLTGTGPASIILVKSKDDGGGNTVSDWQGSTCNASSILTPAPDSTATDCPDPGDSDLWIAGPIVADKHGTATRPASHALYIPFERLVDGNFILYIAKSVDEGLHWIRIPVRNLGPHDAANIFPQLTIDAGGNLYYTWSQAQRYDPDTPQNEGETDAYYTYSTDAGGHWVNPINLTGETGDSAVFPWMVAGSPGQVDLVYYKANSGLNPNIAFYDSSGQDCAEGSPGCKPNTTAWNTYFSQSQNALNPGPNFKSVQISDHPIHTGGICTQGTACESGAEQNRDLLDFLTIDVDHTGAAYTTWASDNNARHDTHQYFSRQLSGNSIFKGQSIAAMNAYPITDHSVTDTTGDVYDATGLPEGSCAGMDILGASATRNNDLLTVSMTLNAPPTAANAILCDGTTVSATGGMWGVQFWAASPIGPVPAAPDEDTNEFGNADFYVAYRSNAVGGNEVQAGLVNSISPSFTHFEFHKYEDGTGGTCVPVSNPPLTAPQECTLTLTASLSGLGIKAGSILSSVSGFSVYEFGDATQQPPLFRIALGNTNLADMATPFDVNGTGTTTK